MATIDGHGGGKGAVDGGTIWWLAPTYGIAKQIWRDLKRATREAWTDKNEVEMRIELPGGGSVTVKSTDNPDGLRGPGLDGVVLDEAAFMGAEAWPTIRPTLADRGGWAILISTPNGFNWFEEMYRYAGTDSQWARWQQPTSQNETIPASELIAARLAMGPHAFAKEHEAKFIGIAGAEFPADYFAGDDIWFEEWPDSLLYRTLALDPSKGKDGRTGDYSAFVKLGFSREKLLYVDADLDRRPAEQIVQDGVRHYREFHPDGFAVETNQFQELLATMLANEFKRQGILLPRITPLDNRVKKEVRIRRIGKLLAMRAVRFKRNASTQLLVNQLREFPMGEHDDGPDALEMAIRELEYVASGAPVDKWSAF